LRRFFSLTVVHGRANINNGLQERRTDPAPYKINRCRRAREAAHLFLMKKLFPLSLIVLVTSALYSGVLRSGFLRDDFPVITENRWITGAGYIPEIFTSTLWGFYSGDFINTPSNYYRPGMHLIYMAAYRLFGTDPAGYHAINLLLHNLNGIMVFLIVSVLMNKASGGDNATEEKDKPGSVLFPLAAALLFAVHPVNAEAVAWAAAFSEATFTFFCLVSIYIYIRAGLDRHSSVALYAVSVFFFILALFSKETAIVMPALLVSYDLCFGRLTLRSIKRYLPYALAAGVFLYIRSTIVGPLTAEHAMTGYQYLLAVILLGSQYIEKLIFPFGLKLYYPFVRPVAVSEVLSHELFVALGFLALLVFSICKSARRRSVIFAALWIAIPLAPAVLMARYIQGEWAFASRYLYMSGVGFSLLLAIWLKEIFEAASIRKMAPRRRGALMSAIALLVLIPFAIEAVRAARPWRGELSYWSKAVLDAPGSATTHASLGVAYADKGLWDEAINEYEAALKLAPDSGGVYMNLGVIHYNRGRMAKALEMFDKALSLTTRPSTRGDIHARMGMAYYKEGMAEAAVQHLEQAVSGGQRSDAIFNILGISYARTGRLDKAAEAFRSAIEANPDNDGARRNLEMLLEKSPTG